MKIMKKAVFLEGEKKEFLTRFWMSCGCKTYRQTFSLFEGEFTFSFSRVYEKTRRFIGVFPKVLTYWHMVISCGKFVFSFEIFDVSLGSFWV